MWTHDHELSVLCCGATSSVVLCCYYYSCIRILFLAHTVAIGITLVLPLCYLVVANVRRNYAAAVKHLLHSPTSVYLPPTNRNGLAAVEVDVVAETPDCFLLNKQESKLRKESKINHLPTSPTSSTTSSLGIKNSTTSSLGKNSGNVQELASHLHVDDDIPQRGGGNTASSRAGTSSSAGLFTATSQQHAARSCTSASSSCCCINEGRNREDRRGKKPEADPRSTRYKEEQSKPREQAEDTARQQHDKESSTPTLFYLFACRGPCWLLPDLWYAFRSLLPDLWYAVRSLIGGKDENIRAREGGTGDEEIGTGDQKVGGTHQWKNSGLREAVVNKRETNVALWSAYGGYSVPVRVSHQRHSKIITPKPPRTLLQQQKTLEDLI